MPGGIGQDLRISDDATLPGGSWSLGMAAGLVPITAVIALDPQGWFPFTVAKWWAVLTVALLAAMFATATSQRIDRSSLPALERVTVWLFAVLLVLVGISAVAALDGLYAWVGTPIRHLGLLAWMSFAIMFAVGRRIGPYHDARRTVRHGTVMAALALGIYSVVELFWGPPVEFVSNSSRLGGPFGSAAYLGAACCLFLPVTIGAATDNAETRRWRIVGGLASTSVAIAVFGSGSRAAIVGLGAAGFVVIVARRGWRGRTTNSEPQEHQRRWAIATGALAVVVASGAAVRAGVFERSAGVGSRLDEWRIATRTIADHAIFGVGPEGYRLVVGKFVDAQYVRRFGESSGIDRAHSGVLDVAVASGIIAAAVYLALLGAVCWCALRLARDGRGVETGLAAAVIAYAVQQQLLFPLAELDPVFWLFAGIVVVRAGSIDRHAMMTAAPDDTAVPQTLRVRSSERHRATTTVIAVLFGASAAVAAILGVRAVAADRLARDATRAGDVAVAIDRAGAATELAPNDVRHRLLLARSYERERTLGGVDRALGAVDDALDISPLEPTSRYEQARLLGLRAAITGTDDDRLTAATAWARVLASSPNCARCHLGAGLAALERGDIDAARWSLHIAADLGNEDAAVALEQIGQS